jgi:hypothetical protein
MVECVDAYMMNASRYMSLRALVLAAFKAALLPDSQGDIWASKEVADSLLPFLPRTQRCFQKEGRCVVNFGAVLHLDHIASPLALRAP